MGLMDQAQAPQQDQPAPPDAAAPTPDQPAPDAQGGDEQIQDHLLDQLVQGIEEKLPPEIADLYHRAVVAGMKVLFSDQTHNMLTDKLSQLRGQDVVAPVVEGTVKLVGLITKESQGKLTPPAAIPAGITLMCHILDFAEKNGNTQITKDVLASAVQMLVPKLLTLFGITKEQVQQGIEHNRQASAPTQTGGTPEASAPPQPGGILAQAQGA